MGGHTEATKTYANAKRFYYWPGIFDWICALTADCLTCQNNKPKPMRRNEVPLEEWQNESVPFRTVHIDHKQHIHPTSASNVHCLLIVDAFSRFLMVYPVRKTTALATITAVENWIFSWNPTINQLQSRYCFYQYKVRQLDQKNLELLQDIVQLIQPGQMVKLKCRTKILLDNGEALLMMPETTGLHWHRSLHSPTTQVSTTQLEKPLMKLSLGPNHEHLCRSSWDFIGKNTNFDVKIFVKTFLLTLIARTV